MNEVHQLFPFLKEANRRTLQEFEEFASRKKLSRGQILALEGDRINYFALVIKGEIRVYKCSESGREITLYKVGPGESCILTAFSILTSSPFLALASCDTNVETILIPADVFKEWVEKFDVWRQYLYRLLYNRLGEVLQKIESLAFHRLDVRLARFLVEEGRLRRNYIPMSHSEIARELGTSREVISRLLKNFEHLNLISLSRRRIVVINPGALLQMPRWEPSAAYH